MPGDLLARARQLSELLSSLGIAHAFIGGLAMNVWSIPVPTYDIDLCADLTPGQVRGVVTKLDEAGFVPPPTSWLESVGSARFQEFTVHWPYQDGLRPADIFLATDEFQASAIARRRRVELDEGFHADIVSPEDLLLYKLVAHRKKDRAGVERLLMIQTSLDWEYVSAWAARLGVTARLREALDDAGLAPA